jgi:two-component system, NarL family, sensor histidine kinase DevS
LDDAPCRALKSARFGRKASGAPYTRVSDPEKLRRLLAAVIVLMSDVGLPELLRTSITESRCRVEARYGALGMLNERRTGLDQFLTVGLDEEEERAIGARPTGRGVLGVLITDPVPLRWTGSASVRTATGFLRTIRR